MWEVSDSTGCPPGAGTKCLTMFLGLRSCDIPDCGDPEAQFEPAAKNSKIVNADYAKTTGTDIEIVCMETGKHFSINLTFSFVVM
jgi:hypothetical protein